jgi:hypothetical protein
MLPGTTNSRHLDRTAITRIHVVSFVSARRFFWYFVPKRLIYCLWKGALDKGDGISRGIKTSAEQLLERLVGILAGARGYVLKATPRELLDRGCP